MASCTCLYSAPTWPSCCTTMLVPWLQQGIMRLAAKDDSSSLSTKMGSAQDELWIHTGWVQCTSTPVHIPCIPTNTLIFIGVRPVAWAHTFFPHNTTYTNIINNTYIRHANFRVQKLLRVKFSMDVILLGKETHEKYNLKKKTHKLPNEGTKSAWSLDDRENSQEVCCMTHNCYRKGPSSMP